jgi:nucleotide-binding universal stress UspA family protein
MRSILVYADRAPSMTARLDTALAMARAMNGHVSVLIDTPIARYVSLDPMGGSYVASDAMTQALADDDGHAEAIASRLAQEGVPYEVLRSEDEPVEALAAAGRLADVVILSRSNMMGGELALAARTPVMVLPDARSLTFPLTTACVAWDGGSEAALVLRRSVPLLQGCATVKVISVHTSTNGFSAADAVRYLARYDIAAEPMELARRGSTQQTLVEAVTEQGAQMLVMGAYSRSRMREYLFGGVTRKFLEDPKAPALLLAH